MREGERRGRGSRRGRNKYTVLCVLAYATTVCAGPEFCVCKRRRMKYRFCWDIFFFVFFFGTFAIQFRIVYAWRVV